MVQLKVLCGKMAGTSWMARRFPVHVGRGRDCQLQLEDAGVWEQHLVLDFKPAHGFLLHSAPNALVCVNGQPVSEALLRNGDTIELGGAHVQFWLGPVRQSTLGLREAISWGVILAVIIAEIYILYWLLD